MQPRPDHTHQPTPSARSRRPSASDRLESLEAAVVVARRQVEALPRLSELLLARSADEREAISRRMQTAASWIESIARELKENEGSLLPRSAKRRCAELYTEAEVIRSHISSRVERMGSSWNSISGCPESIPQLPPSELRELSDDMVQLRQLFWERLYAFPMVAEQRLETLQRCVQGELKPGPVFFVRRSDSRLQDDLLAEARAVINGRESSQALPKAPVVTTVDETLARKLARLPLLPEDALTLSTELQAKAAALRELLARPGESQSELDGEIMSLESDLGDRGSVPVRIAELLEARNRYLTLKTYIFTANIGLAEQAASELSSKRSSHDSDDIHQAARFGLLKAVERWDSAVGTTFSTLARWWIEEAVRHECRNARAEVKIPGHALQCFHALLRLTDSELRSLKAEDATKAFGVQTKTFYGVRTIALGIRRLNDSLPAMNDEQELGSAIADHRTSEVEQQRNAREAGELTGVLMTRLSERDRRVLRLRFGLEPGESGPLTLQEVADRLGLTKERVRQISSRALALMREDDRVN